MPEETLLGKTLQNLQFAISGILHFCVSGILQFTVSGFLHFCVSDDPIHDLRKHSNGQQISSIVVFDFGNFRSLLQRYSVYKTHDPCSFSSRISSLFSFVDLLLCVHLEFAFRIIRAAIEITMFAFSKNEFAAASRAYPLFDSSLRFLDILYVFSI